MGVLEFACVMSKFNTNYSSGNKAMIPIIFLMEEHKLGNAYLQIIQSFLPQVFRRSAELVQYI